MKIIQLREGFNIKCPTCHAVISTEDSFDPCPHVVAAWNWLAGDYMWLQPGLEEALAAIPNSETPEGEIMEKLWGNSKSITLIRYLDPAYIPDSCCGGLESNYDLIAYSRRAPKSKKRAPKSKKRAA